MNDFRNAIRALRRSPTLVLAAVLSLALGIGSNVTVFSVVREMILDDLSARRPEQLVRVEGADLSYSIYRQLRASGSIENLAYHRRLGDRIWQEGGPSEIAWALTTSANFFNVLGVAASRGRLYSQSDEGREFARLKLWVLASTAPRRLEHGWTNDPVERQTLSDRRRPATLLPQRIRPWCFTGGLPVRFRNHQPA